MEYTASEIIERAKNLADIQNTTYISHKEAEQYINDAYNYIYQLAINRGDNFFVKKTDLGTGINDLPRDFYQLRAIRNPYNGHLFTRKALNASKNEPGYEIINGKVEISGINSACEMSYFPKPALITFPDKPKEIEDAVLPEDLFSLWKSKLVYKSDDTISVYDLSTGSRVNFEYDVTDISKIYTSNNYFVLVKNNNNNINVDYVDFEGNVVRSIRDNNDKPVIFRKQNGDIDIVYNKLIQYRGQNTEILTCNYVQATTDCLYYISSYKLYRQYFNESPEEIETAEDFYVTRKFGKDYVVYSNYDQLFAYINEDVWPLDIDYSKLIGYTEDYVVCSDGVKMICYSNEPDILLNYPDNQYFGLLAYQLALYFVAKQGADPGPLSSQFDAAKYNFENNAQDAFTNVRIKNVYN